MIKTFACLRRVDGWQILDQAPVKPPALPPRAYGKAVTSRRLPGRELAAMPQTPRAAARHPRARRRAGILWHGVATVYKLAHDQRLDRHSPGTVPTALMIERLLDRDRAREINFGPGDDPYKRSWASRMREMRGILALNRTTLRGHLGIARHIWGRALKRAAGF